MLTLEAFLKTGHLGPIVLGMSPFDVESVLGEPDSESKKKNPLMLMYRSLHLSFWRLDAKSPSTLNRIAIRYQTEHVELPEIVRPSDWNPTVTPTKQEFEAFLQTIMYSPRRSTAGFFNSELMLPSGVVATFSDGKLDRLQIDQRQAPESSDEIVSDEREPSLAQIRQIFDEAETLLRANAKRPALVMAWSGLEAALRQRALAARLQGRIGVQPMVFIRELQATGNIAPDDFAFIDRIRHERTAVAHGLAPTLLADDDILRLIYLGRRLLEELALRASK